MRGFRFLRPWVGAPKPGPRAPPLGGNKMAKVNEDNTAKKNPRKRGRPFEKGNPGGPGRGNGKDKVCREALAVIRDEFNDEDLRAVVRKLIEKAKGGDAKAAALLLAYKAGKPPETVNLNAQGINIIIEDMPAK